MGSCVSSSHNKTSSFSDSALKLPALNSKPDTISTTSSSFNNDVIYPSTIINNNGNPPPLDSAPLDSDEIMFFDSRGWLDSDCDDDFMSVDGEFTPSRGTTPVHHKFCDQTPPEADDDEEPKHEQEPSPIDNNKKRLLELFKETQDDDDQQDDVAEVKSRTCLWLRTRPITSSAPATPYNNNDRERQQLKRVRSAAHGGCVPRLVSCSSFTDRRRKLIGDVQR